MKKFRMLSLLLAAALFLAGCNGPTPDLLESLLQDGEFQYGDIAWGTTRGDLSPGGQLLYDSEDYIEYAQENRFSGPDVTFEEIRYEFEGDKLYSIQLLAPAKSGADATAVFDALVNQFTLTLGTPDPSQTLSGYRAYWNTGESYLSVTCFQSEGPNFVMLRVGHWSYVDG